MKLMAQFLRRTQKLSVSNNFLENCIHFSVRGELATKLLIRNSIKIRYKLSKELEREHDRMLKNGEILKTLIKENFISRSKSFLWQTSPWHVYHRNLFSSVHYYQFLFCIIQDLHRKVLQICYTKGFGLFISKSTFLKNFCYNQQTFRLQTRLAHTHHKVG